MMLGVLSCIILAILPRSLSFRQQVAISSKHFKFARNVQVASTTKLLTAPPPPQATRLPQVIYHESKAIASNHNISVTLSQDSSGFSLHPTQPASLRVEYERRDSHQSSVLTKSDLLDAVGNAISVCESYIAFYIQFHF